MAVFSQLRLAVSNRSPVDFPLLGQLGSAIGLELVENGSGDPPPPSTVQTTAAMMSGAAVRGSVLGNV